MKQRGGVSGTNNERVTRFHSRENRETEYYYYFFFSEFLTHG